jgi:hypothetical protein
MARKPIVIPPLTEDEQAQQAHILSHTTAGDRILLVEELRLMFGPEHLRRARDLKWEMNRNPDGSEKIPVNWGEP